MTTTVIGIFATTNEAERAVQALTAHGFEHSTIGMSNYPADGPHRATSRVSVMVNEATAPEARQLMQHSGAVDLIQGDGSEQDEDFAKGQRDKSMNDADPDFARGQREYE